MCTRPVFVCETAERGCAWSFGRRPERAIQVTRERGHLSANPNALDQGRPASDSPPPRTFVPARAGLTGKPTADFTIILFPADKRFWVPQARRIRSSRPGTDGKFSFTNIPPGDYKLTAVTDVEPGEWFNPEFLSQLISSSVPVTLAEGERKTQDLRVAGGV